MSVYFQKKELTFIYIEKMEFEKSQLMFKISRLILYRNMGNA